MVEQKMNSTEVAEVAETAAVAAAEASWPQTRVVLRLISIVLGVAAVIWALYRLEGVILLLPQVGEQITGLGQQAPAYSKSISERAQKLERFYQRIPSPARESVRETVTQTIHTLGAYLQSTAVTTATYALTYAPWLVLIPILAFFLLKDADNFRRTALQMLPRGRMRWRGDELFQDVNSTLAAYIRAQLIACLLIGVICTIGFMLIGVPYALVLGILAGFLEFIPLAGPLVMFVLAVTISSFHSPGQAMVVFIFLAALRIVQDYVLYPRIIGQGIQLHPLAVILAILCGAELAGVAGIFLAIPVIAIISVGYRHWIEHKGAEEGIVATLLKPEEAAPPSSPIPAVPPVAPTNPKPKLQSES
ncbi:MAG: AI-2E family transporter [Acidobacteria bacterium]|nr:AI-2E family transporter [Acidobacteriota bacterium]